MVVGLYGEPALYVKAVGNYLLEIQYCITNYTAKLVYQRSMVLLAEYSTFITSNVFDIIHRRLGR